MSQKKKGEKKKDPKKEFFEGMIEGIKGLKEPEFMIEDVIFQVKKLSPWKGWQLMEKIRYDLGMSADNVDASEESTLLFYKAILMMPPEKIEQYMEILFKGLEFRGEGVERGWMALDGSEDMAFQSLEPIHFYELLVRCLAVNFSKSFHAIARKFPGVDRLLTLLKQ